MGVFLSKQRRNLGIEDALICKTSDIKMRITENVIENAKYATLDNAATGHVKGPPAQSPAIIIVIIIIILIIISIIEPNNDFSVKYDPNTVNNDAVITALILFNNSTTLIIVDCNGIKTMPTLRIISVTNLAILSLNSDRTNRI
jgi:hypothetical protein